MRLLPARALAPSTLAAAVAIGCGGAPPPGPTQLPAPSPSASVASPGPVAVASPDLSEAPEPADMIAVVRWRSPEATIATIQAWTGIPMNVRELAGEALGEAGTVVSTRAPVDVVVTLDPKQPDRPDVHAVAFSIGLESLADARRIAEQRGAVKDVGPGVFRVKPPFKKARKADLACVVAAAAGEAPARLVCGEGDRSVDALAPYMTRTLPKLSFGSADLHAEVRVATAYQNHGAPLATALRAGAMSVPHSVQIGQPKFDSAVTDITHALVDEILALANDLDTVTLDVGLEPGAATGKAAVRFKAKQSWTAQVGADAVRRAAPPPAMYWRLPADAASASYGRAADPKHVQGIVRALSDLLDGWLGHEGLGEADRQAIADLFAPKYMKGGASVSASGGLPEPAGADKAKGAPDPAAIFTASLGWHLVGVEESSDLYASWLRAAVGAYNRAGVQAFLKKKLAKHATELPTMRIVGAPKELGKDAVAAEIALRLPKDAGPPPMGEIVAEAAGPGAIAKAPPKPPKRETVPVAVHVLVMQDGGRTWLAFGANKAALVKRMAAVRGEGGEGPTLAGRAGLEPLKNAAAVSGGFMTLKGLLEWVGGPMGRMRHMHGDSGLDIPRILSAIPNHGDVPVTFTATATDSGALVEEVVVRAPKGFIQDAVAAGMGAVRTAGGAKAPPPLAPAPPPPPLPPKKH